MKLLFVSDTYYPHINGVYYFVCRVGPLLQKLGHKVTVIAPSRSLKPSRTMIDGLEVYGVPSLPTLLYRQIRFPVPFIMRRYIRKIIKKVEPDLIHLQDHFSISKSVLIINRELKIPVMGTNHFMPENITVLVKNDRWKQKLEDFLWKDFSKVYNQLTLVTTPTETGADLIRAKLQTEVIAVSSGVALENFNPFGHTAEVREKYGIPDKPVLLYVGRLDPEKHIEEILAAMVLLLKKLDCCFVIVGRGTRQTALQQLAVSLQVSEHVIFTGFVPDADLPVLYKLGRCFVIASIAELLSLATLQGMASGLPVVAVNAGALPEVVKDQENGFLYNEGDIQTMVDHLERILTDDALHERMSEKSMQLSCLHDIHRTADAFEALYLNHAFPFRKEIHKTA